MIDLDELMRLKEAATPGLWSHRPDKALYVERLREIITEDETHVCSFTEKNDAEYIVSVCNAVPELIQRIRDLELRCEQQQHRLDFKSKIIAELEKRRD